MAIKFDTFKVGTGGAGSDTLDDVTSRGSVTTNSVTVGGVTIGTEYSLPATDGSVDQVISTNGSGTLSFTTLDFTGGLEYKGSYDITAAPSLTSSKKGDFYIITNGPGTIAGVSFNTNDHIVFNQDASSPLTSAMFDKIDNTEPALTLDDVTTNGDTTTNAINVGTITTSGDIMPDADATRTIGDENTRFISLYSDINGAIRFKAKNDNGSAITKGQAVYINGVNGTVPTVALAQANSATTMPAFGVALTNANDQAEVQVLTFGNLTSYDTTTYSLSLGDTVYVSATSAGALTNTAPTGESSLIQNIGKVVRAHASDGVLKVGGAGRSNATPNLDQDKIFLGNASNQAVSTALSSVALSSFNDDLSYLSSGDNVSLLTNDAGYLANINSESLDDLSDVSYTAGAGIDNYVLTYDHSTTSWGAEAAPTANPASETVAGVIEIATNAEATAATATDKALVPSNISSVALSSFNDDLSYLSSGDNVSLLTNDAGYLANINSESLNDLSDVSYTAGAGIDNYVLTYDHSTTSWGAEPSAGGGGGGWTYSAITADPANAQANYHYSCTGTFTITLATSGLTAGDQIRIKNMGSGTITIDPQTVNIDGSTTDYVLDVQYSSITLVSDGTDYEVV